MKIGILTYYGVHNHGAVLQANALRNVLESKGHECGFLEFERSYSNISQQQANKYRISLGSISFYAKYLTEKGIKNILYNLKKRQTLGKFRATNIPLMGRYENFNGDLVVIGSDEVYSLEIGVNPFLYGNGLSAKHIISYAASFGPTTYEDVVKQRQETMISDGLHKLTAVSVRDQNSMEIVKKVAKIDAALVCDPVILYGYEKEMMLFTPPMKDYILIYSYDKNLNDALEYDYIKKYAEKNKLKIVSVGYYHKWCKCIDATPFELLGWIRNAKLVVTDTFHGSVMSIICNTPMVVKVRGNQNKLEFLLSEYGLFGRTVTDFAEIQNVVDRKIDFDVVNKAVREKRFVSMKFLDDVLDGKERSE